MKRTMKRILKSCTFWFGIAGLLLVLGREFVYVYWSGQNFLRLMNFPLTAVLFWFFPQIIEPLAFGGSYTPAQVVLAYLPYYILYVLSYMGYGGILDLIRYRIRKKRSALAAGEPVKRRRPFVPLFTCLMPAAGILLVLGREYLYWSSPGEIFMHLMNLPLAAFTSLTGILTTSSEVWQKNIFQSRLLPYYIVFVATYLVYGVLTDLLRRQRRRAQEQGKAFQPFAGILKKLKGKEIQAEVSVPEDSRVAFRPFFTLGMSGLGVLLVLGRELLYASPAGEFFLKMMNLPLTLIVSVLLSDVLPSYSYYASAVFDPMLSPYDILFVLTYLGYGVVGDLMFRKIRQKRRNKVLKQEGISLQ